MKILGSDEAKNLYQIFNKRFRWIAWAFLAVGASFTAQHLSKGSADERQAEHLELETWKRRHDVERLTEKFESMIRRIEDLEKENKVLRVQTKENARSILSLVDWIRELRADLAESDESVWTAIHRVRGDLTFMRDVQDFDQRLWAHTHIHIPIIGPVQAVACFGWH